jgi:hypothetical protein
VGLTGASVFEPVSGWGAENVFSGVAPDRDKRQVEEKEIVMRLQMNRWPSIFVLALSVCMPHRALAQSPDVILEWNRILVAALGTPVLEPTVFFTRPLALMHVVIFDAVNSFDRVYTPYIGFVDVPAGASRDAAVAQAARDTLVGMFPSQSAVYDAALAAQLSRLPAAGVAGGIRVGAAAARAVLDRRATDGWNRPAPTYILPDLPGYWQPVPPQNTPATFVHYPDVTPFVIGSANQFLVGPPPSLASQLYATDFNEVKAIGSATSTTRTADQTLVARLFAAVPTTTTTGIPAVWQNLTRDLIRSRGLNDLEAARLYALINTTFHDALFVSMSGKFLYGFWRPVTAIREADRDGNPDTVADPNFLALIPTPPYPSYPGNYACIASAMTTVFTSYFGRNDIPFSITWAEPAGPGITRSYSNFRQLADEAARSRVYGGIHYNFDTTSSFGVCVPLGDYVFTNMFRRFP